MAELLRRWRAKRFVRLTASQLADELGLKLQEFGMQQSFIVQILQEITYLSEFVEVKTGDLEDLAQEAPSEAHDDPHVLACAIKGKATHIVTYDRKHLLTQAIKAFAQRHSIAIITPQEMLEALKSMAEP